MLCPAVSATADQETQSLYLDSLAQDELLG